MNQIEINKKFLKILIKEEQIDIMVKSIANKLNDNYKNKNPIIIGVLNGSFLFVSDIVKNLKIDFEIDFIKLSSYGNNLKSTGNIKLLKDINCDINNRHIIIVEDIIDTGLTIKFLKNKLEKSGSKSISFVTCLLKEKSNIDFTIDYVGFNIKNKFVVGYGLDFKQRFRGLNSIYTLNRKELNEKK